MGLEIQSYQPNASLADMEIQPMLINKIKEAQKEDAQLEDILRPIRNRKVTEFQIKEGILWY